MFNIFKKIQIAPSTTENEIEAEIWKISVSEGIMGAIHGDFYTIYELYIREWNVAFNTADSEDNINILSYEKLSERYNDKIVFGSHNKPCTLVKKIKLSKELTLHLQKMVESHNFLKNYKSSIRKDIDVLLKE